jgi:PhnB protein
MQSPIQVQPYLMFNGRCQEAIEFYRRTLGAQVQEVLHAKDSPERCPGMADDRVMHACLRIGDTAVMASDGASEDAPRFQGFSLALTAVDDAEAKRRFEALADGGQVQMPLARTFFASSFGMVADRFGVSWMVVTEGN